jgi:hypothetical protein
MGAASAPAIQTDVNRIIDAFTVCNLQEVGYAGSVAKAEVQNALRPADFASEPSSTLAAGDPTEAAGTEVSPV